MLCHVTRRLLQRTERRLVSLTKRQCSSTSTVDDEEARKFSLNEAQWWDYRSGPLAPVHTLNTLRVPFIREALIGNDTPINLTTPLEGYKILDVGCGGGILSEPLARLGANVTGIDPTPAAVAVATTRSSRDPSLRDRLCYRNCSIEDLNEEWADKGAEFDCVVASEVVEHVQNVESFITNMCQLVKPGGVAVITTLNKTLLSYLTAILGAEYLTGVVPRGTHQWDKFVMPDEVEAILRRAGMGSIEKRGMFYNVFSGRWYFVSDLSVNYCIRAIKNHL